MDDAATHQSESSAARQKLKIIESKYEARVAGSGPCTGDRAV